MSIQAIQTFLQESWLPAGLTIVVFVVAWVARFITYHTVRRVLRTQAAYLASTVQFGVVVGGLYGMAIYLEVNPTSVLAVVAILTAGVALAAEQTIANMIAGAVILANGKFAVGEQITIGDVSGTVENIGFGNATINVNTRGLVTMPNSAIVGSTLINHTRAAFIEMIALIPMHSSHDRRRVDALIRQVLFSLNLDKGSKVLHEWTPGGEAWAVTVKVEDYSKRREVLSRLSVTLTESLESEGFPIGVVSYVKQV